MRLNKTLDFAINFANAATNMGIKLYDLAKLCKLADMRAGAWERANNGGFAIYKAWDEQIEYIASVNGFDTEWNGLYPTFVRRSDKREFHLPG